MEPQRGTTDHVQQAHNEMDKFDRIYELHRIFSSRKTPIGSDELAERLECTPATVKRGIAALRDRLNAPIVYSHDPKGYYYDHRGEATAFELPGLWFSEKELLALTTFIQLLQRLEPGLMVDYFAPFKARLDKLLQHRHLGLQGMHEKIRLLPKASRASGEHFDTVATATLQGRRLAIHYRARHTDSQTEREVSPLRLVHYRDIWYLDAWCHLRDAPRQFSLDRIAQARTLETPIDPARLAETQGYYDSAYGIYAGQADKEAVLRFTPEQARWVAAEQWHPGQRAHTLPDGHYQLHIPYHDERELLMDILKYGADVEVIAPAALREAVRQRYNRAARLYEK